MKGYLGCEIKRKDIFLFTKCDECQYRFDETVCTCFRKDHDAKLGYVIHG